MSNTDTIAKKNVKEGKYITFVLDKEEYGIEIMSINQIIGIMDITPIPHTPDYIKGVLNLRGKIHPVIDLRLKFGLPAAEYTERTCIIIVEVKLNKSTAHIGIIVDSVSEVIAITEEDFEETPSFGVNLDTDYILGIAKVKDSVKILLNIDKVLTEEDVKVMKKLEKNDN